MISLVSFGKKVFRINYDTGKTHILKGTKWIKIED